MKKRARTVVAASKPLAPEPAQALPAQALCGAALGLMLAAARAAREAPRVDWSPWPAAAAPRLESFARLAAPASWLRGAPLALVGIAVFVVSWTLAARCLNPRVPPFPFRKARPRGLAWTVVLLSGAALVGGALLWDALCDLARLASRSPDPVVDFLHVLPLSAAGGTLAWLIVAPAGWAGDLEEWQDPLAAAPRSWPRIAGLGAAYGAALALGARACGALFDFLGALDAAAWHPGTPRDALTTALASAVLGALALPAAWSLAAALTPDRASPRQRLKRAAPGLWLAGLAAVGGLALYLDAAYAHGWSAGGLLQAAALPDLEAPTETVVSLQSAAPRRLAVETEEGVAGYYDPVSRSWDQVPATPANASALLRFLGDQSGADRFRAAAAAALAGTYAALRQPETAFRTLAGLDLPGGPPPEESILERTWFARSAPITASNRGRLDTLSDPQAYRIPRHFAFLLSKAWLRFGDLDKARFWREEASRAGSAESRLADNEIPSRAPLSKGVVNGRVVVRGGRRAPITVALVRADDAATEPSASGPAAPADVVASRRADADGSFEFRNLTGGRYRLILIFPARAVPADPELVKVSKNPGRIVIDRSRPFYEAGTIVVSVARAPRR